MSQFTAVTDRATIIRCAAARRRREIIAMIVAFVLFIVLFVHLLVTRRVEYGVLMAALFTVLAPVLAEAVFSGYNSRCPACKAPMGSTIMRARFCPRCGTQLVPDEKLAKPAAQRSP